MMWGTHDIIIQVDTVTCMYLNFSGQYSSVFHKYLEFDCVWHHCFVLAQCYGYFWIYEKISRIVWFFVFFCRQLWKTVLQISHVWLCLALLFLQILNHIVQVHLFILSHVTGGLCMEIYVYIWDISHDWHVTINKDMLRMCWGHVQIVYIYRGHVSHPPSDSTWTLSSITLMTDWAVCLSSAWTPLRLNLVLQHGMDSYIMLTWHIRQVLLFSFQPT